MYRFSQRIVDPKPFRAANQKSFSATAMGELVIENGGSPSPRHIPALSKQTGENGFDISDGFESSINSTRHCFKVRGDCSQLFFVMLKKYKYLIN